jgi:PKD repeat protein
MNYMQCQLIGASYCQILNNTWREFVASYSSGQPQTSGDMLNLGSTSHDNTVSGNDMKYAGHSLIAVGDGITGTTNANNTITNNTLDNPWYKCVILSDDGTGTVVDNNRLLNANSVAYLLSTVHSGLSYSEATVQFSGSNFTLSNNTIDGCVAQYGLIGLGGRYYTGVTPHALVESKNNAIFGNTIQNCQGAAVFSFEQNYVPGVDATVPAISGNLIHDNIVISMSPPSALADGLIHSWDGTTHYEPVMLRSFQGATAWTGLNTNSVHDNWGFSSTNAWRSSYVNSSNATTTTTKTLAQFNGIDAYVYGNSASQPPVAPTANFSLTPSTGLAPLSVAFTDTSTGTPTSWAWNFGDAATSTSQNPSHSFTSAGLYTVTLTATNSGGSTNHSATVTVTVVPPVPPTADFSYQLTSGVLTVTFTDTSTGTPTSWSWDFGDGTTSTAQNPSHTFATGGSFAVVLTSTNGNGSTTRTQTLAVTAPTPPPIPAPSGLRGSDSNNAAALVPDGSSPLPSSHRVKTA